MTTAPLRMLAAVCLSFALAGVVPAPARADGEAKPAAAPAKPAKKAKRPGRGSTMDYGPFLSYSVQRPGAKTDYALGDFLAIKGISVHVGNDATVCFDTDTLSLAGGWAGSFIDLRETNLDNEKGSLPASLSSKLSFATRPGPGWDHDDSFADPRPRDGGPLPADWAHYRGLYRHGRQVVFSYTVGPTEVLELDGSVVAAPGGQLGFTRTLRIGASAQPHSMIVCDADGARASMSGGHAVLADASGQTVVALVGPSEGATLVASGSQIEARFAALARPATFKLLIVRMPKPAGDDIAPLLKAAGAMEDPEQLCHGGPALWPEPVVVSGTRAADKAAYVVDTVPLPDDNPGKAWIRPSGIDFFADGRAALCTWNGDVWIVSGLNDALGHVTWRRFAAGMYEPLGLKIVDGDVYVLGRDQITRLHDLNGDGEADFYENYCNAWPASPIYHAFNLDLQADAAGNFYFSTCGNQAFPWMRMKGDLLKVTRDGKCEVFATGLRAANGLGVGPHDEITCADNQGNWTPVDRINLVKRGGFYGFVVDPRREDKAHRATPPDHYDPPLCWIRYPKPDNSAGGQVWAGPRWGPLAGRLLCTSYGQSDLMEVLQEDVEGVPQGGVVKLPLKFDAGIMRARVSPTDGQVWVTGLKGWQTNSARDGCLQRVRYTGKPANVPVALHVRPSSIEITFSDPLDPQLAADEQSYSIEQWNYRWTSTYGSPEFKLSAPSVKGHDTVDVKRVTVSSDHKTVTLETGPLQPVMQMAIEMHLRAADGTDLEWEIDNTINRLPGGK